MIRYYHSYAILKYFHICMYHPSLICFRSDSELNIRTWKAAQFALTSKTTSLWQHCFWFLHKSTFSVYVMSSNASTNKITQVLTHEFATFVISKVFRLRETFSDSFGKRGWLPTVPDYWIRWRWVQRRGRPMCVQMSRMTSYVMKMQVGKEAFTLIVAYTNCCTGMAMF